MLPSLSIIVPSFNQAAYLEETLLSIIHQQYPALELIVIDGGSTDGSRDIIRKHEGHIAYWVSEPDRGQSHAINKGFEKATGEWIACMNSDDCYLPGAFEYVFGVLPWEVADFLFGHICLGSTISNAEPAINPPAFRRRLADILKFAHSARYIIPSQSVFVRRKLLQETGYLDETLNFCMDLDWYCRIFLTNAHRVFYDKPVSFFRTQPVSKTNTGGGAFLAEAIMVARRYLHHLPENERRELENILQYDTCFALIDETKTGYFFALTSLFFKYPFISMEDVRFRTKLKNYLLPPKKAGA